MLVTFYPVGWGFDNRVYEDGVREAPKSFFFPQTVSSLPLQAAEIKELSNVKKHLDVYNSKMILMFMTRKCLFLSFVWTHTG